MKRNPMIRMVSGILATLLLSGLVSCASEKLEEAEESTTILSETSNTEREDSTVEQTIEYSVIADGSGSDWTVQSGTAAAESGLVKMDSAVLKLNRAMVLPFGEGAEWSISFGGADYGDWRQLPVAKPGTDCLWLCAQDGDSV